MKKSNALLVLPILILASAFSHAQTVPNPCGCEDKPLPAVVATLNNNKITSAELDSVIAAKIQEMRQRVIDARNSELERQVRSILLEVEAKKRGITTTQLLDAELAAKVQTPTEAEAQTFYDQNKARIPNDFNSVKEDIIGFLREEREQAAVKALADRLRANAQVKMLVAVATPPLTAADRARVFATINGQNITSADIEESLRPLIFSVQEQVYNLRKQELELKINDLLLSAEAQKRNITARELLEIEVEAKLPVVNEETALKFYNENKDRIIGEFANIKSQLISYLIDQETNKRSGDFAEQLRRDAKVQVFLTAPEPPVYNIAIDDQPIKGNPKATVTLVEFTDYQCPTCSQQYPVLERLLSEYGDRIRLVVRDFPLSQHVDAAKAAEAAEAAREQGKYWEFVALLYVRQAALQPDKLKQYATELGLDRARFDAALAANKFAAKVQRDMLDGQKIGVPGTPTLYLNGKMVSDRSYEGLKASIEEALKTSR